MEKSIPMSVCEQLIQSCSVAVSLQGLSLPVHRGCFWVQPPSLHCYIITRHKWKGCFCPLKCALTVWIIAALVDASIAEESLELLVASKTNIEHQDVLYVVLFYLFLYWVKMKIWFLSFWGMIPLTVHLNPWIRDLRSSILIRVKLV